MKETRGGRMKKAKALAAYQPKGKRMVKNRPTGKRIMKH